VKKTQNSRKNQKKLKEKPGKTQGKIQKNSKTANSS